MTTLPRSTSWINRFGKGQIAALVSLAVFAICLLLEPLAPWLTDIPAYDDPNGALLPAIEWVNTALEWLLNGIKPVMRWVSWALGYPMAGANWLLTATPWPLVIAITTAIGWRIGGIWMALLGLLGLTFVLISGYWPQSMNTLGLVAVSVPLAVFVGGGAGLLANEIPRLKQALLAVLDAMQTIPTFAYLTPLLLLFGFGPVVGLIASAIYAAPPMARNTLLGLERVETDVKEAGIMSGATRLQQIFTIELPAARQQIMVGLNQCLMASLSMVIIAAVIGGFDDIGWEVLLTMRKADFGTAFLAGLVIVTFAIVIDRMSAALATTRKSYDPRIAYVIIAVGVALALIPGISAWGEAQSLLTPIADSVDETLSTFTAENGTELTALKNNVMFFGMLPLRIGLDDSVLPFTWGFSWTTAHSLWLFVATAAIAALGALTGRITLGATLAILLLTLETGIINLPWPFLLTAVAATAWAAKGPQLALICTGLLLTILLSGLWDRALWSLYLSGISVIACALLGTALGLLAAVSETAWKIIRPICDMLQTIPLFVFLIPVLMLFQIGEFSAFLAIIFYAIVPMIRYTRHGLTTTPPDMMEAATASGATNWQIMRDVRAPYAAPTILLGLNQTILYAFAMLVIAALIGTTGLGQAIYLALGQADVGLGVSAGAAMAILAFIADRLVQAAADDRRQALGL